MVDEEIESDEDVEEEIETFDEEVADEEVSDFSISDTILSVAPTVQDKQSSNLESLAGEKDYEESKWDNSEEVDEDEKRDFYDSSEKDSYNESQEGDETNQNERKSSDLYNEKHEGLYSAGKERDGVYDSGAKHTKSYGELTDNRRSGRSMLEIAGFEDKEKQKNRDTHGLIKYEAKMD